LKYKSASDILPQEILDEVQKYIEGELVYIPRADGSRKKWGEKSGARRQLSIRNDKIRAEHKNGCNIAELADKYYLSESSIKKIVYIKTNE